MDIDCDGQQGGAGEDGRCGSSGDTQSQTSFKDTIISYKVGINDLNAKVHTYVVFGNDGTSPSFDPQKYVYGLFAEGLDKEEEMEEEAADK